MIVSALSDEIMDGVLFEQALRLAVSHGIRHFELRHIEGRRFPDYTEEVVASLKRLKSTFDLTYTVASPGIFKTATLGSYQLRLDREKLLNDTFRLADALGIRKILVFGIDRNGASGPEGVDKAAAEIGELGVNAQLNGFEILIENETGRWADLPEDCLRIVKLINMDNVKLHWDPGNLFRSGGYGYKEGYELVKDYVRNVHVYDVVQKGEAYDFVPLGQGAIDYAGQIGDLRRDQYQGCITVETHCSPRPATFVASLNYLRQLLTVTDQAAPAEP